MSSGNNRQPGGEKPRNPGSPAAVASGGGNFVRNSLTDSMLRIFFLTRLGPAVLGLWASLNLCASTNYV